MAYVQSLIIAAVILYIALAVISILALRKCRFDIETTRGVQSRDDCACMITIRNDSRMPVFHGKLLLEVTNTFTGEKSHRSFRVNVMPRSTSQVDMGMAVTHCGKIRCQVKGGRLIKNSSYCNFTILPEIFPLYVEYNLHESDIYDCENYSPHRRGQDYSEIYQVREYVPGDSVKHIHWKLSGKSDDLMVKDASFPLDKSIMVMMDKGIREVNCKPEHAESLASLMVSVCRHLSDEGLDYQICWNDSQNNICLTRHIQFESELAEAIPAMLTGPVKKTDLMCGQVYQQTLGACSATHVIYISCGLDAAHAGILEGCRITDIDARMADYKDIYRRINLY